MIRRLAWAWALIGSVALLGFTAWSRPAAYDSHGTAHTLLIAGIVAVTVVGMLLAWLPLVAILRHEH